MKKGLVTVVTIVVFFGASRAASAQAVGAGLGNAAKLSLVAAARFGETRRPLSEAAIREAIRLATGASARKANQPAPQGTKGHPVLWGTAIGAAGGMLTGLFAVDPPDGGRLLYGRGGTALLLGGAGAGVGALVGVIVGAVKK